MKHGDKNTSFFHSKASQRRQRNYIKGILDSQGSWWEDIEEVAEVAVDYFKNMFSTGACSRIEECLEAVQQKVSLYRLTCFFYVQKGSHLYCRRLN